MKKNGDHIDGDMVNNVENVEGEGEGSSVGGRGKTVRKGSVQCKLPLSRISGFVAAPRVMCLFCERSFLSAVLLQKHTNRCHRVAPTRRTSARTNEQQNIVTHNYHPGCMFCNSKTLTVQKADDLPALFNHLLDKHSLKYFGCRLCQQRFPNSDDLRSHNQKIHPELVETCINSNSEYKSKDVSKLPCNETSNKERHTNSTLLLNHSYESFVETDLCHKLTAKGMTNKRVSLTLPSDDKNKKELRSRKAKALLPSSSNNNNKDISAIPPQLPPPMDNNNILNNTNCNNLHYKDLPDAFVLIPPPPPPRDSSSSKPLRKSVPSDKESSSYSESIDKKLSRMGRASVTLTPVQIKPTISNTSDTQILSRLGLAQNRSPRTRSLRRNRKTPSAETRSSSEVSRRDKNKGKSDSEFVINKNRIDPGSKFDPDFYATVSDNVRENLLKNLDGKLEKSNVACDVPDVIDPKVRSTHAILEGPQPKEPAEIHGSDVALNAIATFPTLLAQDQYGSDKVPHYAYGANRQGSKKIVTKNSWRWKWDITKKMKQSNDVGKRDLSRLDIWTQLAMRERYDRCAGTSVEESVKVDAEKTERQRQINELNSILDRRVFPDIQSELKMSEKNEDETVDKDEEETPGGIVDIKMSGKSEETVGDIVDVKKHEEETVECVADVKNDKTDNKLMEEVTQEKLDFMAALGLASAINKETNKEPTVFTGEWQRPRCYVCCVCGKRAECLKLMEAHQVSQHPFAQATYYELVGKESLDNELYKHLYIPGSKYSSGAQKKLCRPHKIIKMSQSTRILRTTARNIKSQERPCTKCNKTLSPSELHKHILECAGDYGWMMAKKKFRSNKPFGVRRRRLKGLYKRERPQDDGERPDKDVTPRPKVPSRPRSKPSDVETIQRMLANLPPKRTSKQVLDLPMPKPRQGLNNKQRRILPDTKLGRSKTTVVRTIKDGKLRRVTRSRHIPDSVKNKNVKTSDNEAEVNSKKVRTTPKPKKDADKIDEASSTEESPKKTSLTEVKRKKQSIVDKEPETPVSLSNSLVSKERDRNVFSKNDVTSVVIEDDNENTERQRRLLRRRPENISSPKVDRRTKRIINQQNIDKCTDSNSENTQNNGNDDDKSVPKVVNNLTRQIKAMANNVLKRKSKKVLGLPLKWMGKRVSRLKKKKQDDTSAPPVSESEVKPKLDQQETEEVSKPVETIPCVAKEEPNAVEKESKTNKDEHDKPDESLINKLPTQQPPPQVQPPVAELTNTLITLSNSNDSPVSLSNDPKHTNSNLGFSNFGNQSHSAQNQGQYRQQVYNSTVQGSNVSNLGSKTLPLNYNHTLSCYNIPKSLQITSHSKHDTDHDRTTNMHKADDFAIDNIDKPPLFSSVRAQTQMQDLVRHDISPPGYSLPVYGVPTLAMQKAYPSSENNFEIAHSQSNKSKMASKTNKRGLNDCIAMLRGKLTARNTNELDNCVGQPSRASSISEDSSQFDDSSQPLDLSGRCQAEDLSMDANDGPHNFTLPKPQNDDEVQDLSMKSAPLKTSTPTKHSSSLLSVRKPIFDPSLRIPQFSVPVEQFVPKPANSQSAYITSPSCSTKSTPHSSLYNTPKLTPASTQQPAIDLASNISHELSLLPQALVNTIEKLPPFQQEEIVKVLPQVLVKAVENFNLLRNETSIGHSEQDILKNISLGAPIELTHSNESPSTREEHIRIKPTTVPQTSEISTQTSVPTKEEDLPKCSADYMNVNNDLYLIDPISGVMSERKVDQLANKMGECVNVLPLKPIRVHEVIDLTDEVTVKEPEEVIPAAIIEKPKDPDSQVRSVVILDPASLDKSKTLERSKSIKGTASLRAVRIKSTSEKLKIKNMALNDKPDPMPHVISKSVSFVPEEVKESVTKTVQSKEVVDDAKEDVVNSQQSTENTITSSKDMTSENADVSELNVSDTLEAAIQQDEVSSTQHSSVEDNVDNSEASISRNISPLCQKLTDIQSSSKTDLSKDGLPLSETESSDKMVITPQPATENIEEVVELSVKKGEKAKVTSRKKKSVKATAREKKVVASRKCGKLKENTRDKETNTVVDKRDKCEPKSNDSECDKKTSFNNLLKECNKLSESALTPSNVNDFHTDRKSLDKCDNVQISEPIQDDVDPDRGVSLRRSLRGKKTILKETEASIEKDTNIFENRDHSSEEQPVPDLPGAMIPEESYKANLGSSKEIISNAGENKVVVGKDESDDDDICLAAFSKKKAIAKWPKVAENTDKLAKDLKSVSNILKDKPAPATTHDDKIQENKTCQAKSKKKASRQKKSGRQKKQRKATNVKKSLVESCDVTEVLKDVPVQTPSICTVVEKVDVIPPPIVKESKTKSEESIIVDEHVSDAVPSDNNASKKETTRKSGRLKSQTQTESFASIDSVKLNENGHLIFKMNKPQNKDNADNVEKTDSPSTSASLDMDTSLISPDVSEKTLKPVAKSRKVKKSKGEIISKPDDDTNKVSDLVLAVELVPSKNISIETANDNLDKKQSEIKESNLEDESEKPLISFRKNATNRKQLETKEPPVTTTPSRKTKQSKAATVSENTSTPPVVNIKKDQVIVSEELVIPEAADSKDVSNSSDEDIVLCKLVPKKKLKKLKSRSSPRTSDVSKELPTSNILPDATLTNDNDVPLENIDKIEINLAPEPRKSSTRIKNMTKKLNIPPSGDSVDVLQAEPATIETAKDNNTSQTISPVVSNDQGEFEKPRPVIEKRSTRRLSITIKEIISSDSSPEVTSKKNKKVTQPKVSHNKVVQDKDSSSETESRSEPVEVSSDMMIQSKPVENTLLVDISPRRRSKTQPIPEKPQDVENQPLMTKVRTKAACKDAFEETPSAERLPSSRSRLAKNSTSKHVPKMNEVPDNVEAQSNVEISSTRRPKKKLILNEVESPLKPEDKAVVTSSSTENINVISSPRKSAKRNQVDREIVTENTDATKPLEKSSSKEVIVEPVKIVPERILSPRRSSKKVLQDNESQPADNTVDEVVKVKRNLKESFEECTKKTSAPEVVLSPRRSTKKSAMEMDQKEENYSPEVNVKPLIKESKGETTPSPKKPKKKSILERELLIKPVELENNSLSENFERVLSPRKSKKRTPVAVESSSETVVPTTEFPTPRKSSPKKVTTAIDSVDESLDTIDDEPLAKSIRKSISEESEDRCVRRKSSRTASVKDSTIDDIDKTLDEVSASEKDTSDNVESDDTKLKVRTSARSSLRSNKPEDEVLISSPKSLKSLKSKTPIQEGRSDSLLDEPVNRSLKVNNSLPSGEKKKQLLPIIIDTTPSRKEDAPQSKKKHVNKKSVKALPSTKRCLVSLDELDVDKVKQDLLKETLHITIKPSVMPAVTTQSVHVIDEKQSEPVSEPILEQSEPVRIKSKKSEKKKSLSMNISKIIERIVPSPLLNPDIIESSSDINSDLPIVQTEKTMSKRQLYLDISRKPSSRKRQIVHVDVHVPKEDSNIEDDQDKNNLIAITLDKKMDEEVSVKIVEAPSIPMKLSVTKKSKKHKKKNIEQVVPDFNITIDNIDDDLSSEEPLQSIVDTAKKQQLLEEEASDKTDSSICLANLVTTKQRKTKKKKFKLDKHLQQSTPAKKLKYEDKTEDGLVQKKSDKSKSVAKRKRKTRDEVIPANKLITDDVPSQTLDEKKIDDIPVKDSTANTLPIDPESIQDKYLADFGMYTEKRPRKSTLLAMKKISKTFRPDGEDNSDDNKSDDETQTAKKSASSKKVKKAETKLQQQQHVNNKAPTPPPPIVAPLSEIITSESEQLQPKSVESQDKVEEARCESVEELKRVETPGTEDETEVSKKQSRGSEYDCKLCKRKFRRLDNLMKHKMTLMHISRVSEVEAKERENSVLSEEKSNTSSGVDKEQHNKKVSSPQTGSRIHKNLAERKSFDNNKNDIVNETKCSPKPASEIAVDSSRKTLSTDEALFFECCSLLKESNDLPIGATVEPASDAYPLANEQNNSSSDSTPYISGVKNILKASQLVPPSLTGESDNTIELSQTDSNSDILHAATPEDRAFAFVDKCESVVRNEGNENNFKHFLVKNKNIFGITKKSEEVLSSDATKGEYDPYSAESLMARTNSDDFSDNGDSMISSHDVENNSVQPNKNIPSNSSDKSLTQPIFINEFEDKFDKIKRKAREKAQAAQEAMAAVIAPPRSHSKKSSKKSTSKSRKSSSDKKGSQTSQPKTPKIKNKSKKKNIIPISDKSNSKKVLTKGALKGFDSVKVSINSEEINFQDVLESKKHSPNEYQHDDNKDLDMNEFGIDDEYNNSKDIECAQALKKQQQQSLPLFGKENSKQQNKLKYDNKISMDSPTALEMSNDIANKQEHDIYEFMDDEDDNMSDSFKFRTPTAINRAGSSKKGGPTPVNATPCPKSSLDAQNDDSQISSLSFSDRDDFTYMSDDYNAHESEEETNLSSNSMEGATAVVSKSSKKHKKSSKHRNIKKNAIMGKIFKNNAIRNNDQASGNDAMIDDNNQSANLGSQSNMDQLFDSLLDQVAPDNNSQEVNSEVESKNLVDVTDTDDVYSAGDEIRRDGKPESNVRSPSVCESDSDNDDDPNPSIPAYPRTSQRKIVPRLKARSSDDESPQPKQQQQPTIQHLGGKKSEIGIASHKSQRKCTTGKQNVLVESWSSESDYEDFRQFEEYSSTPRLQKHHRRPRRSGRHRQHDQSKNEVCETIEVHMKNMETNSNMDDENKISNFNTRDNMEAMLDSGECNKQDDDNPNVSGRRVGFTPNIVFKSKSSKRKRRQSQKPFDYDDEFKPARIAEPLTTQRRNKRAASEMLYYWSSSSDDDVKNTSNDAAGREPEPVEQHGWIVGDSHKKLVTMLAHAKGRKVDDNSSVKEKKSRPSP